MSVHEISIKAATLARDKQYEYFDIAHRPLELEGLIGKPDSGVDTAFIRRIGEIARIASDEDEIADRKLGSLPGVVVVMNELARTSTDTFTDPTARDNPKRLVRGAIGIDAKNGHDKSNVIFARHFREIPHDERVVLIGGVPLRPGEEYQPMKDSETLLLSQDSPDLADEMLTREATNPIQWYLNRIGRYRLLEADEEKRFGRMISERNEAVRETLNEPELSAARIEELDSVIIEGERARDALYLSNLRFVVDIAKKFRHLAVNMDLLDIINEGNFGLMEAVERFDYTRGYKFSTFAGWWIKKSITSAIYKLDRGIYLPVKFSERGREIDKIYERFLVEHGREPTAQEIVDRGSTGLTTEDLEDVRRAFMIQPMTLETARPGTDGELTLENSIPDKSAEQIEKDRITAIMKEEIRNALENTKLDRRERVVISLNFALVLEDLMGEFVGKGDSAVFYDDVIMKCDLNNKGLSFGEIGGLFGLTKQRIDQIQKRALGKILSKIDVNSALEYLAKMNTLYAEEITYQQSA